MNDWWHPNITWREFRDSIVLPKTQEELLCVNLEARYELDYVTDYHGRAVDKPVSHQKQRHISKPLAPCYRSMNTYIPHRALPGEVPMKVWIVDEANKEQVTESAIWKRYYRGDYQNRIIVRHATKRACFVSEIKA